MMRVLVLDQFRCSTLKSARIMGQPDEVMMDVAMVIGAMGRISGISMLYF